MATDAASEEAAVVVMILDAHTALETMHLVADRCARRCHFGRRLGHLSGTIEGWDGRAAT